MSIELWANQTLFDTVTVDGSARTVSAPFYPTGAVDRLVMVLKNDSPPAPTRPLALWHTSVPTDSRELNLAVADIQLMRPGRYAR